MNEDFFGITIKYVAITVCIITICLTAVECFNIIFNN